MIYKHYLFIANIKVNLQGRTRTTPARMDTRDQRRPKISHESINRWRVHLFIQHNSEILAVTILRERERISDLVVRISLPSVKVPAWIRVEDGAGAAASRSCQTGRDLASREIPSTGSVRSEVQIVCSFIAILIDMHGASDWERVNFILLCMYLMCVSLHFLQQCRYFRN